MPLLCYGSQVGLFLEKDQKITGGRVTWSFTSFQYNNYYLPSFSMFSVLIADFIQYNMWDCLFCFLRFGFYECFTSIQYNNYYLPSFSMFSMLIADFIQYNNMWDCWFCFLRFGFYEWF